MASLPRVRPIALLVLAGATLMASAPAEALCTWWWRAGCNDTYTQTRYPIVLAHGLSGWDTVFGFFEYFYGIPSELRAGGATVYATSVSQFNSTAARGEQIIEQLEELRAIRGDATLKFNLIGHSQGGLDVRYVAGVRPDLVASVTAVGGPHQGADLANFLDANIEDGSFTEYVLATLADSLGAVLGILTGSTNPQDAIAAIHSLTSAGAAAFNASFPAGLPSTPCGQGSPVVGGIPYFSWSGTGTSTNLLDPSDILMMLMASFYSESNDGLVGHCSAHLGQVIRDDYLMNHADEINQGLGLVSPLSTNPKQIYRTHANRLKNMGL